MIVKNKLDKSFGPVGSTAGFILFVVGIITTYSNLAGIFFLVLGAFVGFSSTGSAIDFGKRRIKYTNNLFGIILIGKWIDIDPCMKVGVKESNIMWRAYSRSNRTLDIANTDFRVVLYDTDENEIMVINKNTSFKNAMDQLEIISKQLGILSI